MIKRDHPPFPFTQATSNHPRHSGIFAARNDNEPDTFLWRKHPDPISLAAK
jgi:hypothetical protein